MTVYKFCEAQYSLSPEDDFIWSSTKSGSSYVWAIMGWSADQSDCGIMKTQYPSGDDAQSWRGCMTAFGLILDDCEGTDYDEDERVYAGGGWVLDNGKGCVTILHFATTEEDRKIPIGPKPRLRSASGADNITDMWHLDPSDLSSWRVPLNWNLTMPAELMRATNVLERGWRGTSEP
jgi:hypothetical protein